jgi:hypothetical protein
MDEVSGKDLHLFSIQDGKVSPDWGTRRNPFTNTFLPQLRFEVYSNENTNAVLTLTDKNGFTIQNFDIQLKKGLSSYSLTLDLQQKSVLNYEGEINKIKKKKEIRYTWPNVKDGNYLLSAGEYKIIIKNKNLSTETAWTLKD